MEISSFHVRKCVLAATLPSVRKVDCAKTALKDAPFDACSIVKFKNRTDLADLNMDSSDPSPKLMTGELYTKEGKPKADETSVTYSTVDGPKGYFQVRFHENCSPNKDGLR